MQLSAVISGCSPQPTSGVCECECVCVCVCEVSGECECASGEWFVFASVLHHGLRVHNNNTVYMHARTCACHVHVYVYYVQCVYTSSRHAMLAGNLNIYTLGNFGSSCASYNCILTIKLYYIIMHVGLIRDDVDVYILCACACICVL